MKTIMVLVIAVVVVGAGIEGYKVERRYMGFQKAASLIAERNARKAEILEDSVRLYTESAEHATKRGDAVSAAELQKTAQDDAVAARKLRTVQSASPVQLLEAALFSSDIQQIKPKTEVANNCVLEGNCQE